MKREGLYRVAITALFVLGGVFFPSHAVRADLLDDLRDQLQRKRNAVNDIDQQIKKYQKTVDEKRSQAVTLQDQIGVIDDSLQSLQLQLDKTNAQADEVDVDIEATNAEIEKTQQGIDAEKEVLREYVRELETFDANSGVESFFKYPTLSQAISELRSLYRLEQQSQETLGRIRNLQDSLSKRKDDFVDLQRELSVLKTRQQNQQTTLNDQQDAKNRLLDITAQQEKQYRNLLSTSVEARKQANADIQRIDAQIRAELEKQGGKGLGTVGNGTMDWPIEPIFGISCGFHCPGYPYQSLIGSHTADDMPTPMGTGIHAPADGYVAKISIAAGSGFSYMLIIHGDNISTMYGHISGATVHEGEYVTRGQLIGYTGGAPGTRGAGLSTGPHLHFEVRRDGIPVDPLQYLSPRNLPEGATGVYS